MAFSLPRNGCGRYPPSSKLPCGPGAEPVSLRHVSQRKRAAAVIVRDGRVLMVHERSRRSGGGEWWTLPGGGLE
ncbi:MAG TPA: NUDIX domain-containing protein, partial [Actinoplanes sp.]|nr:NUDIX domain-containing protein [Actinoplanes sp.]